MERYVNDTFTEEFHQTIGLDFDTKFGINFLHKSIKVQVWDTAGMEKFRPVTSDYFGYVI